MVSGEVFANFLCDRDQQHASNRVADESRNDLRANASLAVYKVAKVRGTNQYDPREHQNHSIQRHICYDAPNEFIHYIQQPAARYPLSEGDSAHCEENHGPQEVFEVILDWALIGVEEQSACNMYLLQYPS